MNPAVSINRDAVMAFCRRHHTRRLALFRSVLGDDFRPDSDVDMLVQFEFDQVPALDFIAIERECSGTPGAARRLGDAEVSDPEDS